jgi:deoxyadenosine/deoxycytidine kinase
MASTPPKTPVTSRQMSSTSADATPQAAATTSTAATKPSPDSVTQRITKSSFGDPNSSVVDDMGMENVFIGISGLIGAGKTTLAAALAKVLGLPVYYEPVADNIYLEDYYKDMSKYAFGLQVYLLNRRFKQHQQIVWTGHGGVQDRTIYEDAVFAKMLCRAGHLDERDYKTYISLFNNMSNFMKKPNIIVHLDVSPEESLRRVRHRDRDCESGMTLDFLQVRKQARSVLCTRCVPVGAGRVLPPQLPPPTPRIPSRRDHRRR